MAAAQSASAGIRALLSKGAHINALDTNRESPIFRCLGDKREGNPDRDMLAVVKFLAARGANLTLKNKKGKTCLQKATRKPVSDYLKTLSV